MDKRKASVRFVRY